MHLASPITGAAAPAGGLPTPAIRRPRRRRSPLALLVALPAALGLFAASAVVWQSSQAAFSATTSNASNSWATGTVSLSDDDSGVAMFTATDLVPGSTGSKCIGVGYTGVAPSTLGLYVSASTGATLPAYLRMTVEEGTGGTFASCSGFTPTQTIANNMTLQSMAASNTDWASRLGSATTISGGSNRIYRFTYTLDAATPDNQQGTNATATFRWESRTV